MDDVGWGDFGCYGGGVAVGAPTPNVDRLAREGLMLTSCYSEPSCTPTRASIMTGRLPMRHGLLIPPMYGMPGGLQGEITLPQILSDAGYVTQAVGKWHMGENRREPTATRRLRRLLRLPLGVRHVHRVARSVLLPGDRLQRGAHRVGARTSRSTSASCTPRAEVRSRRSRRSPSRCSRCSTTSGASYSEAFIERHGRRRAALVPVPLHPRRALRQLPAPRLSRPLTREASLQGRAHRARRHLRPPDRRARTHGSARVDDGRDLVGQRARDGDVARLRVHAVPVRQGLDLGGRRARPGGRLVAGNDRRRVAPATASCTCSTCSRRARPWPAPRIVFPTIATSMPSTRRRSCSRRPTRRSRVEPQGPALLAHAQLFGGPGRRVQVHVDVDHRQRHRCAQPRRVHGIGAALRLRTHVQPVPRSQGVALVHDPQAGVRRPMLAESARHRRTFREWPNKPQA